MRATPLETSRVARAAAPRASRWARGAAGDKRAAWYRDAWLGAVYRGFRRRKFLYLLGLCVLYPILLSIFGADDSPVRIAVDVLAGSMFIAVMFATRCYRPLAVAAVPLTGAIIGVNVMIVGAHWFGGPGHLATARTILSLALILLGLAVFLRSVLRQERVTADKVLGAVCVYLLLGAAWGLVYLGLHLERPGSFQVPALNMSAGYEPTKNVYTLSMADFVYLSFETISTLGTGDIRATTIPAETLVWLEAVAGQIYLAVLIARLVSLHIVHSTGPPVDLPPGTAAPRGRRPTAIAARPRAGPARRRARAGASRLPRGSS
jgi:Ion channel